MEVWYIFDEGGIVNALFKVMGGRRALPPCVSAETLAWMDAEVIRPDAR